MASGQDNALKNLQRGTYGKEGERIDWTYYDTETITTGTQIVRLFQVPLGTAGKTEDFTNLSTAGMMPQGQKLRVFAIKVFWTSQPGAGPAITKTTALDVESLYTQLARTVLKIRIENKAPMGVWTLQELLGLSLAVGVNPALTLNLPFQNPRFHGIFPLNKKITLSALVPFFVEITHSVNPPAAVNGDLLKIGLAGELTRVG